MNRIDQCHSAAIVLHTALARTTCLQRHSPQCDTLWRVVEETICTRGHIVGTAWGSDTAQDIGGEDARHNELVAAMMWLIAREDVARQMKPDHLFRHLRATSFFGQRLMGFVTEMKAVDAEMKAVDLRDASIWGRLFGYLEDEEYRPGWRSAVAWFEQQRAAKTAARRVS